MSNFTQQELVELEFEMASIQDDFDELSDLFEIADVGGNAAANSDEMAALEAELEESEFGEFSEASGGDMAELGVAEDDFTEAGIEEQGLIGRVRRRLRGIFRRRVAKLIRKLIKLVRRHRKLIGCVPKVTKAVVKFKAGKYKSALKDGWQAYRCIKANL